MTDWSRRDFLKTVGLTTLGMGGAKRSVRDKGKEVSRRRRNIVLIQTDSWDGRVLGCMGHPAMRRGTLNIDRLAGRGVLFRNTYCSHPICCPSRANMWSGRYTHNCESWNNHKGLQKGAPTFKTYMERAGYRFASEAGGFGKHDYLSGGHTHLARMTAWTGGADIRLPVYRMAKPMIVEGPERLHGRDWEDVANAKGFLEEHAKDERPFMLYLGLRQPHPPFTTCKRWLDMVDRGAVAVPPEDGELHPVMEYQRIIKNWMHGFSKEMVLKTRGIYYAMCAEVDAMVGEVMGKVDELGLAEKTYVIFTSDHGENNMEHRQFYKMNFYESSARVPLVIAGPGIKKGAKIDNIVSLIDIYPTLMDMAGIGHPKGLEGESLMALLTGKSGGSRNRAFAMFTGTSMNTTAYMLREGEWKYVAYVGYEPQLFNLVEDEEEIRNYARAYPDVVKRMDRRLREVADYERVHEKCMRYNKASFRKWREEARAGKYSTTEYGRDKNDPADTYEEIMANSYMGWTGEHEEKLKRWLES